MFTGLVGPQGVVTARQGQGEVRFTIDTPWPADGFIMGESIACDGACMTVVAWQETARGSSFDFVASVTMHIGNTANEHITLRL